ncbi:MAG: thiamine-binding protein [Terracidiphilus sp.]
MLLELSVLPKGKGRHASEAAADLARIIDTCGLYHQAKNKGTVLEGNWDQLMAVAKKCHDEVLKSNQRIVTVMRAVDGPEVAPCAHAPADCAAMRELLEDDGDWLIP